MGRNIKVSDIMEKLTEDERKSVYDAMLGGMIIVACFFLAIGVSCGLIFSMIFMG